MYRRYPNLLLDLAIERDSQIPRKKALKCVNRQKKTKGPIFAHTYDKRLPQMAQIQARHWRTMVNRNSCLADIFTRPPQSIEVSPIQEQYLIREKLAKKIIRHEKVLSRVPCLSFHQRRKKSFKKPTRNGKLISLMIVIHII